MRICLALAVFLMSAVPAMADTEECKAAPTRDCVFAMALRQADEERRLMQIAKGYLAVAYLQEQEQSDGQAATRAALLARLVSANPDPVSVRNALTAARTAMVFYEIPVGTLPETDQWIMTTLDELAHQAGLPDEKRQSTFLSPTLLAQIKAKVAAAPADPLPKFARLTEKRGPEISRLDTRLSPRVLGKEHAIILTALFAKGALSVARAEIAGWPDVTQRANGLAELALAFVYAGEPTQALDLMRSPELADLATLDIHAKYNLVEVLASVGDGENAAGIMNSMGLDYPEDWPSGKKVTVIAAMVNGEIGKVSDLLDTAERADRFFLTHYAVEAVFDRWPDRVEALLPLLPPDLQIEAIYALGERQIEVGQIDGAVATIERLDRMPSGGSVADISLDYKKNHYRNVLHSMLAPVLAAIGDEVEAVKMTADLGWPATTALVAARLE